MERFFYIAIGAGIAVVIIGAALVVRDALEDRREALDARIKNLARGVCLEVTRNIRWYNINGLEERVEEMIDSKLAEKEGRVMREILFRGKRLDNGEWVEGYLGQDTIIGNGKTWLGYVIKPIPEKLWDCDWFEVDPATVGQFIDREDLHGSRIFEGDIVDHGRGRFVVRYIKSISRFAGTKPGISFAGFSFENSVKVGNIYDNPELLEVSGDG